MTSDNSLIIFYLSWRKEELRFYRGYCSDINKENDNKQRLALAYCKRSVDLDGGRETYHRNYGCALERIDKINKRFGENKATVIDQYKKSVRLSLENVDNHLALKKPFHVLLSYYECCIRAALHCEITGNYESLFHDREVDKIDSQLLQEAVHDISDFFKYAKLSVEILPQVALHQKMFGFACSYVLLLKIKKIQTANIDSRNEAETMMKETIWFLEKFCENDNYIKDLQERKERLINWKKKR